MKQRRAWVLTLLVIMFGLVLPGRAAAGEKDFGKLLGAGGDYYKNGDYLNAFQLYEQALKVDEKSWEANVGAGNALYKMGRPQAAVKYYRRSLELKPDNSQLRAFLEKVEAQLNGEEESKPIVSKLDWLNSYDQAMNKANKERKYIMIFFFTEFSAGVPLMERKVFSDKQVEELSKKFVCVRVDGNEQRQLAKYYRVGGYPTVIFADGEENERGRGMTVTDPEKMLKLMQKVLDKNGKWRAGK